MTVTLLSSDDGFVITDPDVPLPQQEGEILIHRWVDAETVPTAHRDRARTYVDRAARELGIGHLDIRYFVHAETLPAMPEMTDVWLAFGEGEEEPKGFWARAYEADVIYVGVVPPDQTELIALNAGLRGDALEIACRHEVRHIWQRLHAMTGDREADADRYAWAV